MIRYRLVLTSVVGLFLLLLSLRCVANRTQAADAHAGTAASAPTPSTAANVTKKSSAGGHAATSASAAGTVQVDPARVTVEVRFRVPNLKVAWTGGIRATHGRVVQVSLWPAAPQSKVNAKRFTIKRSGGKNRRRRAVVPSLHITLAAKKGAVLELTPAQGTVRIELDKLRADSAIAFLGGRVTAQRIGTATAVTRTPRVDEDYPAAVRGPNGTIYVAYVAYQRGTPINKKAVLAGDFSSLVTTGNGDRVMLGRLDGNRWLDPIPVTAARLDVQRPTIAVGAKGEVWVTWSRNTDGNWDLYRRRFTPNDNRWSDIKRLTKAAGADINVVSVADANGTVWWAWQGWQDGNFDIHLAGSAKPDAEPIDLSRTQGNEWNPAIAADAKGNIYVAWDSYDRGNYDVLMRRVSGDGGTPGAVIPVAVAARFEARVSLAVDGKDRVWIAYEQAGSNWGKDFAAVEGSVSVLNRGNPLYLDGTVAVRCFAGGTLQQPVGDVAAAWGGRLKRAKSFPRLGVGADGRVWLTFRTHPLPGGSGERWASYATHYTGEAWTPVQTVPGSDGLVDNRPVILAGADGGTLMIQSGDGRMTRRNRRAARNMNLHVTRLAPAGAAKDVKLAAAEAPADAAAPPVHEAEAEDVKRLRAYRVEAGGKTYRLLRGEFHRHTEYTSHRDQDGSLESVFRYGLDAAAFEWIGDGDHDNGAGREYDWWTIQKTTSLFQHPGVFFPVYSYERSNRFPNGHRNVIFTRRGIRPLLRGSLKGNARDGTPDTKLLYKYLHHFDGICASHTSGTGMGTDWRDNDPVVEPIVEIYQGHRHSYEHFGAPRTATPATNMGGYQPAGYIWNALARGYRFGFESSSDHVSTHMSYAIVLAEQATREGVFQAFKARRCYGATDNILLIVRCGDHLMGEAFTQDQRVTLNIKVVGTTPIAGLDIIRDSGYVYSSKPNRAEVELTWSDKAQVARTTSYYYVRVIQTDGNLAWSSPMWVHYAP